MKYYNPEEVAAILKVKPQEVYQYMMEKKLVPVKMGSNYRLSEKQLEHLIKYYAFYEYEHEHEHEQNLNYNKKANKNVVNI